MTEQPMDVSKRAPSPFGLSDFQATRTKAQRILDDFMFRTSGSRSSEPRKGSRSRRRSSRRLTLTDIRDFVPTFKEEKVDYNEFLKETLGKALCKCLHDVATVQPADPIEYMAKWLYRHVDNQVYYAEKAVYEMHLEQERKALDARHQHLLRCKRIQDYSQRLVALKERLDLQSEIGKKALTDKELLSSLNVKMLRDIVAKQKEDLLKQQKRMKHEELLKKLNEMRKMEELAKAASIRKWSAVSTISHSGELSPFGYDISEDQSPGPTSSTTSSSMHSSVRQSSRRMSGTLYLDGKYPDASSSESVRSSSSESDVEDVQMPSKSKEKEISLEDMHRRLREKGVSVKKKHKIVREKGKKSKELSIDIQKVAHPVIPALGAKAKRKMMENLHEKLQKKKHELPLPIRQPEPEEEPTDIDDLTYSDSSVDLDDFIGTIKDGVKEKEVIPEISAERPSVIRKSEPDEVEPSVLIEKTRSEEELRSREKRKREERVIKRRKIEQREQRLVLEAKRKEEKQLREEKKMAQERKKREEEEERKRERRDMKKREQDRLLEEETKKQTEILESKKGELMEKKEDLMHRREDLETMKTEIYEKKEERESKLEELKIRSKKRENIKQKIKMKQEAKIKRTQDAKSKKEKEMKKEKDVEEEFLRKSKEVFDKLEDKSEFGDDFNIFLEQMRGEKQKREEEETIEIEVTEEEGEEEEESEEESDELHDESREEFIKRLRMIEEKHKHEEAEFERKAREEFERIEDKGKFNHSFLEFLEAKREEKCRKEEDIKERIGETDDEDEYEKKLKKEFLHHREKGEFKGSFGAFVEHKRRASERRQLRDRMVKEIEKEEKKFVKKARQDFHQLEDKGSFADADHYVLHLHEQKQTEEANIKQRLKEQEVKEKEQEEKIKVEEVVLEHEEKMTKAAEEKLAEEEAKIQQVQGELTDREQRRLERAKKREQRSLAREEELRELEEREKRERALATEVQQLPVKCAWNLREGNMLVCFHPVLGELMRPTIRDFPECESTWYADEMKFLCQSWYDSELYTECDPHQDDILYKNKMIDWTLEGLPRI